MIAPIHCPGCAREATEHCKDRSCGVTKCRHCKLLFRFATNGQILTAPMVHL